jgi:hypothetical protein
MIKRYINLAWCIALLFLSGCAIMPPPRNVNHICHIFKQYPRWYRDTKSVERRWRVPVHVQMAIVHQESKFDGAARPPRRKLLWVIPWSRPTTAYGYSQALDGTWSIYQRSRWRWGASRDSFGDAVDFIGWYANQAYKKARIPRNDPYRLYLAYHEGIGGYTRKTYLRKPWLIQVAHKVSARSALYRAQLQRCH